KLILKLAVILNLTWLYSSCIGTDVIEELNQPEQLQITSAIMSIQVGDSVLFMADYFNQMGERDEVMVDWSSTDNAIISIDANGLARAHQEGEVLIFAMVNALKDSVMISAGAETIAENARMATFQGKNNYTVEGDAFLEESESSLTLRFDSNFRASNGPGLHVYLSNSAESVAGGVDLGSLKSNTGAQTYTVPDDINLNTYNFIIIYCQPFNVPFGAGELN
ncbi:hypothetical protein E1176_07930, partial [Fulvivirga sp. RKSG066]|uniref:DM13 domain-containing protein n=1 Tax=Fulvivirga aurantia TaxID=2529383 RepID=UPI0016284FFA